MVDFQQRCPVFEETTGWMRGAPEIEQTRADMNLLQTIISLIQLIIMKTQYYQLTQIRKDPYTVSLNSLDRPTFKNIMRLLNRESYQLNSSDPPDLTFFLYINPQSKIAMVWNFIFLFIFYLFQLQISLSLAFGPEFFENTLQLTSQYLPIYLTILALLAVDIFFSFFKGFYAFGKGKVIDDGVQVAMNYLKFQFPFDIIIVILYIIPLIHQDRSLNFVQLIPAALIWIKKFKNQNQIQTFLQYYAGFRAFFMIVILFLDVLMIGNYGACMFVGIDLLLWKQQAYGSQKNSPYYWLIDNTLYGGNLIDGPWQYQYVYGQAFASGTLSTLAPGPFARNPIQIVYAIVVMVSFMILASYVAEVLIQIVYTYTERRIFHEDNIISFDKFMQLKQVGKTIRKRIYNFFQLIWEVELKMETKQQETMINKLPSYLKEQLLQQIGFTKHIHFLDQLPHSSILKKMVSLKIQRSTADSNTCIFQSHKPINTVKRNIFYIKQGMAKFYLAYHPSQQGNILKKMQVDKILNLSNVEKVLGVYQFVTGQNYSICCKSITLCLVQSLSWTDFWGIVSELKIQESFHQIKDRVLVERQFNIINKVCVVCLQPHLEQECPKIYPKIDIRNDFIDQNKNYDNKRKKINRKMISSKKHLPQQQQDKSFNNVFNMFPTFKLGQLLLGINKLNETYFSEIQEVAQFGQYFKKYNIIEYH